MRLLCLCFLFTFKAYGFILLSGPEEARLPVSFENPSIDFHWDGSTPKQITNPEKVNPNWAGLSIDALMQELLLYSLDKWNNIPGSFIQLNLVIDQSATPNFDDGVNALVSAKTGSYSSAAFALPHVEEKTITDCDITIATTSVDADSLIKTLIHEIGHCLGLGHNHQNYGSIMSYSRDTKSLNLGADDMAGVIYLYPDPDYGDGEEWIAPGCGVISSSSHGLANVMVYVIILVPLALMLIAPRRRNK